MQKENCQEAIRFVIKLAHTESADQEKCESLVIGLDREQL